MTNLIIISYLNEIQAREGAKRLAEIESIGDITIYESVLFKKDERDNIIILQEDISSGTGTIAGMAIGGLIGALAGPVGLVVGLLLGTLTGIAYESDSYSFSEDFAKRIAAGLLPGMAAIIAEVDEEDHVFLDTYAKETHGTLIRTDADAVYEVFDDRQVEAWDAQIASDRSRLKTATASERDAIWKNIGILKEKRRLRLAELKTDAEKAAKDTKGDVIETRAEFLQNRIARYKERITKLENELKRIRQ
ncbi:DUF1269 domain-containing protein [Chitinophaga silvatica]|uniref:DUF1269 domain-containing protein n=1 Tax=Chitinophaga silvatica TaxID=2282649 RepID=A0A3E1YGQ0_9BACT|nr:DUF1269 domain-containing protein [Chitinophaga silvatica]RFS26380.1 DUF1269 domain-containing protein [Chitinophaga silvatica]